MSRLLIHLLQCCIVVLTAKNILSSNELTSVSRSNDFQRCAIIQLPHSVFVNCSAMFLTTVPILPKRSTTIRLDQNNISRITDLPFLGMTNLQTLNISYNPLKFISPELFKGLLNLQRISLLYCKLFFQPDLDYDCLLSDVINATEFALSFDYYKGFRPCDIIRWHWYFTSIKRFIDLQIDSVTMSFLWASNKNQTLAKTRKLTLLNDWNGCIFFRFRKQVFSTFVALEELTIFSTISLHNLTIEQDAFQQLSHLRVLIISISKQGYDKYEFTNQLMYNVSASVSELKHLRELRMEGFSMRRNLVYLNCSNVFSKLSRSKSLRTLSLNNNLISLQECFRLIEHFRLPPSLFTLEMRENYLTVKDIFGILTLSSGQLRYVDARVQNNFENKIRQENIFSRRKALPKLRSGLQELYISHSHDESTDWFTDFNLILNNLTILELSWLKHPPRHPTIPPNFIEKRPQLRYLDLSGCKLEFIDAGTFKNTSTLQSLFLSYNSLAKMGSNLSTVLKDIRPLEELSLASNGITDLTEDVFRSMTMLATIDLSGNLLATLTPTLKHLGKLKLLNISNNKLAQLSPRNQKDLDKIRQTSAVVVDFTENHFLCNCHSLPFIKWVVSTNVILHNAGIFSCKTSTNEDVPFDELENEIKTLESACASYTILALVCSISAALSISFLVCAFMYRFRWRLRYLYYMAKLRVSKSVDNYERIHDYDAFISYSSEDFSVARCGCIENLENTKGLRLFIHERDFTPGQSIAYNISVGIHSSKITVFFLSASFLSSEWCIYEFNMARMESLYSRRTVMLIVLLENTVVDKLPVDILDVIRSVTYLEYPEHNDENDVAVFWNRLTDCIRES